MPEHIKTPKYIKYLYPATRCCGSVWLNEKKSTRFEYVRLDNACGQGLIEHLCHPGPLKYADPLPMKLQIGLYENLSKERHQCKN